MHEEPDTCRICSAPAETDAPLFHPCKCSGTIRYIHQDCLTTWLAHSKKKTCDVCKYQYSFTKVYSENMPKQIPFILFLRKLIQKTFWGLILAIRGIMVAIIWLAFLPYVTVWTWRFYFIMGENIAWWVYDHPRPNPTPAFHSYFTNLTFVDGHNHTASLDKTIIGLVTSYPVWCALWADIFTGQIIAALIVLIFLGIFLLREWIIQNARPGVFEEDELMEDDEPEAVEGDGEAVEGVQVGEEPALAEEVLPAPPHNENELVEVAAHAPAIAPVPTDVPLVNPAVGISFPRQKRRLPSREDIPETQEDMKPQPQHVPRSRSGSETSGRDWSGSGKRERTQRRKFSKTSSNSSEAPDERGKDRDGDAMDVDEPLEGPDEFKFTFEMERPAPPSPGDSSPTEPPPFSFNKPEERSEVFRYTPKANLPYPIKPGHEQVAANGMGPGASSGSGPRRPPLPDINLSSPGPLDREEKPAVGTSFASRFGEPSNQPLPSPSLSTYRAPEELDGGYVGSSSSAWTDLPDDEETEEEEEDEDEEEYKLEQKEEEERESVGSSAIATVAESAFREDLEEYFRDDDAKAEEEEIGGPIRVEELLGEEDVRPEELERNAVAEAHAELAEVPEDQDGINEDDVDGALEEAIGMRGPITTVFQNAALMIFVLDTTIGLAVWLPFTVGKSMALLSLEPIRMLQLVLGPLRIIRYVTDPMVDSIALVLSQALRPVVGKFSESIVPAQSTSNYTLSAKTLVDMDFLKVLVSRGDEGQDSAIIRGVDHVANSPVAHFLEPHFARLGKEVRLNAASLKTNWIELANGNASFNRVFAVALGYLIGGFLLAIYLNVLKVGNVQSAGRAVRNAIRQQLIVLKVATFIVIELAVFPLGCGVMLDFCTLELFPDASVRSRVSFFAYAPVTATFYHWMVGTMFMYQFAIMLGGCRKILRPGGLWFIKDPQDQNFHPIRDILDRPTLVQVRKLAISALMYSFVVAFGMGGLVCCLHLWGRILLPLRWKLRQPLSDIPIDLLFLHIIMPSTIKYFRPRKLAYALATKYWKWAARQLRLTSYMFGGMPPEEMRPSMNLFSYLASAIGLKKSAEYLGIDEERTFDGGYRRVPAQDNIALPREIKATVAVDRAGEPLDEVGRRLMDIQNKEAEKAKRRVSDDYTVVYLPPHFKQRVISFIVSLWLVGSSLFVAGIGLPVWVGRAAFALVLNREVHDGYSIILGFYLLWGCYYVGRLLDRLDKRRQRSNSDEPRGQYAVYVFKRVMLWMGNLIWVAFWFGVVIPTLLALVVEVYLVHPLRIMVRPELTLNIRIFDSWALGLVYTKMALSTMRLRPQTRVDAALKEMKDNGWRRLNAVAITLDIIAPVTAGLLGMLLLPITVILTLKHLVPDKISSNTLFLYVYPGIFIAAAVVRMYIALQSVCGIWAQQIRDSEFLVEMRLRNLEPPAPKPELNSVPLAQDENLDDTLDAENGQLQKPDAEDAQLEMLDADVHLDMSDIEDIQMDISDTEDMQLEMSDGDDEPMDTPDADADEDEDEDEE